MDDEPRRLVDDDEVLVLVDDVERHILADERRFLRRRRLEGDARALRRAASKDRARRSVDPDFARLDQRLQPGARERDAPRRRRLAEEAVEPLARVLRADVENLQPFGAAERSEGLGFSRRDVPARPRGARP